MSHCEDSDRLPVFFAACNKSGSGDQLRLPPPTPQHFERHHHQPPPPALHGGTVVMAICNCGVGWQSRSSSGNLCRSVSVLVSIGMMSLRICGLRTSSHRGEHDEWDIEGRHEVRLDGTSQPRRAAPSLPTAIFQFTGTYPIGNCCPRASRVLLLFEIQVLMCGLERDSAP